MRDSEVYDEIVTTLSEELVIGRMLGSGQTCSIVQYVVHGVSYAWEFGIVHRLYGFLGGRCAG